MKNYIMDNILQRCRGRMNLCELEKLSFASSLVHTLTHLKGCIPGMMVSRVVFTISIPLPPPSLFVLAATRPEEEMKPWKEQLIIQLEARCKRRRGADRI